MKSSKICFISIAAGALLYASFPAYQIFVNGKFDVLLNTYVPYADATQLYGFIITLSVQMMWSSYLVFGNMAYYLIFIYVVCHYKLLIELFDESLKSLGKMYSKKKNTESQEYKRLFFLNICVAFQDIDK